MTQDPASPGPDDQLTSGRTVGELGPTSTGRWVVRTRDSEHLFDLDAKTYRRSPGKSKFVSTHDQRTATLTCVELWPRVGEPFLIWIDDPDKPDLLEHWHKSSIVQSITAEVATD